MCNTTHTESLSGWFSTVTQWTVRSGIFPQDSSTGQTLLFNIPSGDVIILSFMGKLSLVLKWNVLHITFFIWRLHGQDVTTDHNKHNMTKTPRALFYWHRQEIKSLDTSAVCLFVDNFIKCIFILFSFFCMKTALFSNIILHFFQLVQVLSPASPIYSPILDHEVRTLIRLWQFGSQRQGQVILYNHIYLAIPPYASLIWFHHLKSR